MLNRVHSLQPVTDFIEKRHKGMATDSTFERLTALT